jgi:hypothetical protein
MGGRERLRRVLDDGDRVEAVVNTNVDPLYHARRMGEVLEQAGPVVPIRERASKAPVAAMLSVMPKSNASSPPESNALEVAKASERHRGTYERFKSARIPEIEKSIRSLTRRIDEHEDKIKNPTRYVDATISPLHLEDLISRYWPNEIADLRAKILILQMILQERQHG